MADIRIVLRKKPNKNGTYPLALRITRNRKTSYIYIGHSILLKDWDKDAQRVRKSHPNSVRLNSFLITKLADATDGALEVDIKKEEASARTIRNKIKPKTGASFFPQAQDYLDTLKESGKYNQYTSDKPRIAHFKQYLNDHDIAFNDISIGLLEKFQAYLRSSHKSIENKKPMSERTVVNHLVVIRSVFAHARKNGIINKEQTPFGGDNGIKIKFPDSAKAGIPPEAIIRVETIELTNPKHNHARNLWLFSFYFAGMRISDIFRLRWSDFKNGRLHYSMGKNDKGGSLKIPDKAQKILEQYTGLKQDENDFVFPELKSVNVSDEFVMQRTIAFKTSALDKILNEHVAPAATISQKMTMHIARHSFGSIAGDAIPIQMLQKLYRHSNVSTTIGYQSSFINRGADDALDAVINSTKS